MTKQSRLVSTTTFAPLGLLLFLHAASLTYLFMVPEGIWTISRMVGGLRIASGLVYSEIAVIAAWAAWSQMAVAIRLLISLLLSLLAGIVLLTVYGHGLGGVMQIEQIVITLCAVMLHCLLIQGMCLAARAFGIDWRNVATGETPVRRQAQFHLWEMLVLTAAAALFLGAFRLLWPPKPVFEWNNVTEDILIITTILLAGNFLLANTVVTVFWVRRGWLKNVAITLAIAIVITLLEWLATLRLIRPRTIQMLVCTNGLYMGWLLMSLGLVRLAGYRLERVRFPKWTRVPPPAEVQS
jgi:hypothetical protein